MTHPQNTNTTALPIRIPYFTGPGVPHIERYKITDKETNTAHDRGITIKDANPKNHTENSHVKDSITDTSPTLYPYVDYTNGTFHSKECRKTKKATTLHTFETDRSPPAHTNKSNDPL